MSALMKKYLLPILIIMVLLSVGCGSSKKIIIQERDKLANEKTMLLKENVVLRQRVSQAEHDLAKTNQDVANTQATLEWLKAENAKKDQILHNTKIKEASLQKDIRQAAQQTGIQIQRLQKGLVFSLPESILFPSSQTYIKNSAKPLLRKLAKEIKQYKNRLIMVEGHTDSLPIKNNLFRSNWDLGARRAITIVNYLQWAENFPPHQLCAVTFGQYKPIDSNKTIEGRKKNRRVEITVLSEDLSKKFNDNKMSSCSIYNKK